MKYYIRKMDNPIEWYDNDLKKFHSFNTYAFIGKGGCRIIVAGEDKRDSIINLWKKFGDEEIKNPKYIW